MWGLCVFAVISCACSVFGTTYFKEEENNVGFVGCAVASVVSFIGVITYSVKAVDFEIENCQRTAVNDGYVRDYL